MIRVAALTVPRRFRGPTASGNGGWTSGALATLLVGHADTPHPAVRVRLSAPPPLETPMVVARDRGSATLSVGDRLIATATLLDEATLELVPPVSHDRAVAAAALYPGLRAHPFPECFSCGTARPPGDGLRLQPGPVEGSGGLVAAAWTPDESLVDEQENVPVPVLWAALDCPGGWAVDLAGQPMVLGTMTAGVDDRPRAGEPLVVVGRVIDMSERKATTATTLYRATGETLAVAAHVWVTVDPATFGAS